MPFIPTGYLKHSEAINRVAEIINGRDPVPPLTQEERNTLQGVRDRKERAMRPPLREVTPIHSLSSNKPFVPHQVRKFVEAEPPPQPLKISREEFKNLMAKEARIKEQHHIAGKVLRQLLYAGRVPSETLNENGLCIETPKHIWGGKQWDEALRSNWVEFPGAYGLSVSGRPIILLDALEAAFNPDGTVKEEPQPGPAAQNLQLNKGGRRPASQSKREEILAEFDKLPLTFKRGELAAISEVIAKKSGYKQNTVEGILRPGYKELEQKQGSK